MICDVITSAVLVTGDLIPRADRLSDWWATMCYEIGQRGWSSSRWTEQTIQQKYVSNHIMLLIEIILDKYSNSYSNIIS